MSVLQIDYAPGEPRACLSPEATERYIVQFHLQVSSGPLPRRPIARTVSGTEARVNRPAVAALSTRESSVHRFAVEATHFLRTKKITSATTTTAPRIPAISDQFKDGFTAKLAVMV